MKEFKGDLNVLQPQEKFMKNLIEIENCKKILTFLQYKKSLSSEVAIILNKIRILQECVISINQSNEFKNILFIIRQIGNFLNFGTSNGKAFGFSIFSLEKIDDVKSFNKEKTSLLEFLVLNVKNKNNQLINFYKEFKFIQEASQTDKNELEKNIMILITNLNKIKKEKETKNENFLLFSNNVEKYSSIKIECVKISNKMLDNEIENCVYLFGEDEKKFDVTKFIKIIFDFVEKFKLKLIEISQKEAKLLKKKINEEKKKKKKENEKISNENKKISNENKNKKINFAIENKDNNIDDKFIQDFQKIRMTVTRKTLAKKKDLKDFREMLKKEKKEKKQNKNLVNISELLEKDENINDDFNNSVRLSNYKIPEIKNINNERLNSFFNRNFNKNNNNNKNYGRESKLLKREEK